MHAPFSLPSIRSRPPGPPPLMQVLLRMPDLSGRAYAYACSWWNEATVDQYLRCAWGPVCRWFLAPCCCAAAWRRAAGVGALPPNLAAPTHRQASGASCVRTLCGDHPPTGLRCAIVQGSEPADLGVAERGADRAVPRGTAAGAGQLPSAGGVSAAQHGTRVHDCAALWAGEGATQSD